MAVNIRLEGDMIARIHELAEERREGAILNRTTGSPPWLREEAEAANRIERHRKGVAAEYAVKHWLSVANVPFTANFEDVGADLGGAPDIEISAPHLRCDVKATCKTYPEAQRNSLPHKDIVIWCYAQPEMDFSAGALVTSAYCVDITGWTYASDIMDIPRAAEWIDVPEDNVKSPQDFLAMLGVA